MRFCLCFTFIFFLSSLFAETLTLNHKQYFIFTNGISLSELFKNFGKNYDINVRVSPNITDKFQGKIDDKLPLKVLSFLKKKYNLAYYFDGSTLYVDSMSAIQNKIVSLEYENYDDIISYLKRFHIISSGNECSVTKVDDMGTLSIEGIPPCITRVNKLINDFDQSSLKIANNQEGVIVVPLKYASAEDRSYKYRDQNVNVPGVASVLRSMINQKSLKNSNVASDQSLLPTFTSDSRENAVIVRDKKSNLPLMKNLIEQLDKKQPQIQISVEIIDVDASNINSLGINWAAAAKIGGGSINFNSNLSDGLGNQGFTTILDPNSNFQVSIDALAQQGKSKILSRPSVVTLNNVQAILDKNVTFYTEVSGEKVADLKSVTTGSLLRVTPRLIEEHNHGKIMLTLDIQDGKQEDGRAEINNLPTVANSEITTQAILKTGQSLLLGGFVVDETRKVHNKIPLLGDIPVLGHLFSSNTKIKTHVLRLFLIKANPIYLG